MDSNGNVEGELRLEGSAVSETSTWPSTPEQQASPPASAAAGTAPSLEGAAAMATRTGPRRPRLPKRPRREATVKNRRGLSLVSAYSASLRSSINEPGLIMKFSTMAAASGGLCLVVAVFSGPALVFLAVLAAGVCGMCYSVRQRGALEYLPSGVVELLTRTTLLEFLTDTSVFDAVKTYLVFMMGLSEDETEGVLGSLPEDMRHTLTRPGIMHTLPRPFQDLLLPPNATSRAGSRQGTDSDRGRRRLRGRTEGFQEGTRGPGTRAIEDDQERYEDEEREPPLGQLVWNPLPAQPESNLEAAERLNDEQDDPYVVRAAARRVVSSEEEEEEEEARRDGDQAETRHRRRRRARSASSDEGDRRRENRSYDDVAAGDSGISRTDRLPWEDPPSRRRRPDAARSLSPVSVRDRARGRAVTDVGEESRNRARSSSRRAPSAHPAARRQAPEGWMARMSGISAEGGILGPAPASDIVPSAERLVASILQRRVDGAVKAAWNAVDERGVRRAAVGSGIALAAHVALSERARRQASGMLRGSLLAALAATATVCAGLVYLKPGDVRERTSSDATDATDQDPPVAPEEEEVVGDFSEDSDREHGERRLSRMQKYRHGMQRWLISVTPSTRNMVRLLGMICLLLAVRKWQLLRRAALRATMPRSMYGATPP